MHEKLEKFMQFTLITGKQIYWSLDYGIEGYDNHSSYDFHLK
jgi:hypothetical protein